MSASLYLLSRVYPVVFMLPVLNIPVVNTLVIRLGSNLLEKVCIDLPCYVVKRARNLIVGSTPTTRDLCILITQDQEFPDYELVTIL